MPYCVVPEIIDEHMNKVLKSKFGYNEITDTNKIIDKTMVGGLIEKAKDVQSFCRAYGTDYKKLKNRRSLECTTISML